MAYFPYFNNETSILALRIDGLLVHKRGESELRDQWIILVGGTPDNFTGPKDNKSNIEIVIREISEKFTNDVYCATNIDKNSNAFFIWEAYSHINNDEYCCDNIIIPDESNQPVIIKLFGFPELEHDRLFKRLGPVFFAKQQYSKYGENAYISLSHIYHIKILNINFVGKYSLVEKNECDNPSVQHGRIQ